MKTAEALDFLFETTLTAEAIKKVVEEQKANGMDQEEIEKEYTAALRYKLISIDEFTYAMEQIWN